MKRLKYQRLLLVSIVASGLLMLSGCSGKSCPTGNQQLPANWSEMNVPVIEGGNVCVWDDKYTTITYSNTEFFEFADKYAEKFKSGGWTVSQIKKPTKSSRYFNASRDKKEFTVFLRDCDKSFTSPATWSKCTDVKFEKTVAGVSMK